MKAYQAILNIFLWIPLRTMALPLLAHSTLQNEAIPPVSRDITGFSTSGVQWSRAERERQERLYFNPKHEVLTEGIRSRRLLNKALVPSAEDKGLKDQGNMNSLPPTHSNYPLSPTQLYATGPALAKHHENNQNLWIPLVVAAGSLLTIFTVNYIIFPLYELKKKKVSLSQFFGNWRCS